MKTIKKFTFIFAITVSVIGFSGCEHISQVVDSQADSLTPIEERDHVWPIDQNGVEVPIPGTWILVSHTHLNSTSTIGETFTLPPDDPHTIQISEGIYTDGDGILWTKIKITTADGDQWQFLERIDTSVIPHQLHVVVTVNDNGIPILEYAEYPFDLPRYNVQIWERK